MVVSPCTLLGRAALVTLPAELGLFPCLLRLWREGKTRTSVNTRVQFTLSFVTAFLQGLELAAAAVWSVATEETGFAVGHHQLPRRGWGQVSVMQRGRQPLRLPSAPECGDRGQNKPISLHLCSEDLSSLTFRRQPVRCFHPFPATSPQAPEDRLCVKNCFFCRTLCWTHIHRLNLLSSGLNRYSLFTSYGPTLPGIGFFSQGCCRSLCWLLPRVCGAGVGIPAAWTELSPPGTSPEPLVLLRRMQREPAASAGAYIPSAPGAAATLRQPGFC
ncbi:uncharacterized protein LOC141751520 [Larus michahellis]|uniref:uncharacterized protein LOC141751520 n=1 Tax=Larus michahellis TaxID=119627 RepID=UPI003D9B04B2